MKPKLSIIIPCLNEEKHIEKLLNSIKKQKFPCEIIVADAGSSDKTVKVAKRFKAKVIKGGMPARGRNLGAKKAKSDLLLFLDADVMLPHNFLKSCCEEMQSEKLDAATCYALPISEKTVDILNYEVANAWMEMFKKIKPYAHGFCIFAKKKIHQKIRGFNESLRFGEDSDYVNRASKIGKFDIIKKYVYTSVRRFDKEGRIGSMLKYSFLNVRRLFGEIKDKNLDYKFGHYD